MELRPNFHIRIGRKEYDVYWLIVLPIAALLAYGIVQSIANYPVYGI